MSIRKTGAMLLLMACLFSPLCGAVAQDWGGLKVFAVANAELAQPADGRPLVVLMGDSITEIWPDRHPSFFDGTGYVGRGISGQVSAQMLVRFRQDVIGLHPAVVVINAGTNDVAENQGPFDEDFTLGNIISMTELARANGIAVVLTSVLPAAKFSWRPALTDAADKIAALNARIKSYAEGQGIPYVDYYSSMVVPDHSRALNPAYSKDGVHPVTEGYVVMEPLLAEAVQEALRIQASCGDGSSCQPAASRSGDCCGCR